MIPGTEANPGLRGVSRYENTSLAIPAGAKEKDGAYAFISWFTTEGAKDFLLEIGRFADQQCKAGGQGVPHCGGGS